jgi:hypothetical protein
MPTTGERNEKTTFILCSCFLSDADIRSGSGNYAAFHEYSGVITNATGEPRKYVQLHFMGFNDDGDLVYYDQTYAKSTTMRDGAQSLFAFLVPPERSALISTYRCYAHAD